VVAPVAIPDSDATVELYLFDSGGQDIFREQLNTFVRTRVEEGRPPCMRASWCVCGGETYACAVTREGFRWEAGCDAPPAHTLHQHALATREST
jgi:hypothetical protein